MLVCLCARVCSRAGTSLTQPRWHLLAFPPFWSPFPLPWLRPVTCSLSLLSTACLQPLMQAAGLGAGRPEHTQAGLRKGAGFGKGWGGRAEPPQRSHGGPHPSWSDSSVGWGGPGAWMAPCNFRIGGWGWVVVVAGPFPAGLSVVTPLSGCDWVCFCTFRRNSVFVPPSLCPGPSGPPGFLDPACLSGAVTHHCLGSSAEPAEGFDLPVPEAMGSSALGPTPGLNWRGLLISL